MSDNDYLLLRTLISKYGFFGVFKELRRIAGRWADHSHPGYIKLRDDLEFMVVKASKYHSSRSNLKRKR